MRHAVVFPTKPEAYPGHEGGLGYVDEGEKKEGEDFKGGTAPDHP